MGNIQLGSADGLGMYDRINSLSHGKPIYKNERNVYLWFYVNPSTTNGQWIVRTFIYVYVKYY